MGILRISALLVLCLAGCGKVDEPLVEVTVTTIGPGTVTSMPADLTAVAAGTKVTFTPATGVLLAWGGACSGSDACTVTAAEGVGVSATFEAAETLTVTPAGTGSGSTTSMPAGIDCGATCTAQIGMGSLVTLTQTTSDPSSRIGGWSAPGCKTNEPCTVAINGPTTVTSYFDTMAIDTAPTQVDITDVRSDGAISLMITVTVPTVVTELDADLVVMTAATNVRFAIFNPAGLLLYASDPVAAAVGRAFVPSPAMSFVMVPGITYQVAAIVRDTAAFPWGQTAATSNGFTTIVANGNPTNFTTPLSGGGGGVIPRFQIFAHPQ